MLSFMKYAKCGQSHWFLLYILDLFLGSKPTWSWYLLYTLCTLFCWYMTILTKSLFIRRLGYNFLLVQFPSSFGIQITVFSKNEFGSDPSFFFLGGLCKIGIISSLSFVEMSGKAIWSRISSVWRLTSDSIF